MEEKINTEKIPENKRVKINKAVSFNAIKNMAFEIFFNEHDQDRVSKELEKLFIMGPVTVRKDRNVTRKKISDTQSMNFQKRKRKHGF